MSVNDISQLLFSAGILINALLAVLTYLRTIKTSKAIATLEKNTNSIKDALVKVTGESEHAKGMLQGAIDEKAAEQKRRE